MYCCVFVRGKFGANTAFAIRPAASKLAAKGRFAVNFLEGNPVEFWQPTK